MHDIPMFTTENGIGSLVLSQIPYQKKAYIRIQSTLEPDAFLKECYGFCRAAGAEEIYATGISFSREPDSVIIKMQAPATGIGDTDALLMPVTDSTLDDWVRIYNEKVIYVPNGAYMTSQMAKEMLRTGGGYWIHREGSPLGIGKISGSNIDWIASVAPGAGADILKSLCHGIFEDTVTLEVSSANKKAIKLYESLGFVPVSQMDSWYRINY